MQFFSTILAQFVHRLPCFENEVYFYNYLGTSVIFLFNKRNRDHFQNHIICGSLYIPIWKISLKSPATLGIFLVFYHRHKTIKTCQKSNNTSGSLLFCRPVPLPIFPVTRGKVMAQAQFLVETWRTRGQRKA